MLEILLNFQQGCHAPGRFINPFVSITSSADQNAFFGEVHCSEFSVSGPLRPAWDPSDSQEFPPESFSSVLAQMNSCA